MVYTGAVYNLVATELTLQSNEFLQSTSTGQLEIMSRFILNTVRKRPKRLATYLLKKKKNKKKYNLQG